MPLSRFDLSRISLVLFLRGFLLLMLAAVAVRWPEATLLTAMVTAGGVVGILGLFELTIASFSGASRSTRTLLVAHGALSVAFGIVAVSARLASTQTTVTLTSLWLLLHAVLAVALVRLVTHIRRAPRALLTWGAVNLGCALVAASYSRVGVAPLLYLGTLYAATYGVAQISVGLWIRRHPELTARMSA